MWRGVTAGSKSVKKKKTKQSNAEQCKASHRNEKQCEAMHTPKSKGNHPKSSVKIKN